MADECNIKVVCRVRPLNESEKQTSQFVVKFPNNSDDQITLGDKTYKFDKVIPTDIDQEAVYNTVAKSIVADVLGGYNGTIFAYGQTSSGKTYTMEGVMNDPQMEGIIPRIIQDIFNYIYQMDENLEFHIKVSYYEIYLDKIRDLLDVTKMNLAVHEDKNRVPYVKNATERFVSSPEEMMEAIEEGKANRHVAVTNMNEHSSRSHSIFLINIKQENRETEQKLNGKLYLVDLAGSEKVSKTGAEGALLDEAKNINKSLSALGNVISALADGNKSHVPYRDSKLTRILQESLGGNARTTIVICCSPASYNEAETKSTLLFGVRAKTIKNCVTVNLELTADEWRRRYEREKERSAKLRAQLLALESELQRWRRGETVPESEQINWRDAVPQRDDLITSTSLSQLISPSSGATSNLSQSVMLSPPTSTGATANGADKKLYEDEKRKLYSQLDEKDDELFSHGQLIEQLQQQINEQEELLAAKHRDAEQAQSEAQRLQAENDASKEEVKEVLQALEELALNYDIKSQELDTKRTESEQLQEDITKNQADTAQIMAELETLKETAAMQRRRLIEMVQSLLKDLHDLTTYMPANMQQEIVALQSVDGEPASIDTIDTDFTMSRLQFNRLKSDLRLLVNKLSTTESSLDETKKQVNKQEEDISEVRLELKERDQIVESLRETSRALETKKRHLEDEVDRLQEKCGNLEKLQNVALDQKDKETSEKLNTARQMTTAMEQQMEKYREQHQRQLSQLRDELSEKQNALDQLRETNQKLQLHLEKVQTDCDRLRNAESTTAARLAELTLQMERRTQAADDLKDLQDTVAKELQTLHSLRKMFVHDLQARLRRRQPGTSSDAAASVTSTNDGADGAADALAENGAMGSHIIHKQKISFLENNLDQLTKVHKQLVRDNADLRCEIPKLEKRLRATMDRVKVLETALKEAKESALKDRRRYQAEVDRIKEAVRQRSLQTRKGPTPQIIKPVMRPVVGGGDVGAGAAANQPKPVIRPSQVQNRAD